jgi:dihydroflavonol-4-reductase
MKYLVTGATGFLGGHLVQQLREAGHDVRALCRGEAPLLTAMGIEIVHGDVTDAPSVENAARGADGVFHCAGMVSRDPADAEAMWRVHVVGTRTTLAAARTGGVKRVVLASTSGIVAVAEDARPRTEDDETPVGLIARWPYYRSKLYAEQAALEMNGDGLEVVCVNPSLLLGPGDLRGSSTEDVRLFLEGKLQAVPAGGASFVDVRDAAAALIAAMNRGRAGRRYLVSACNLTVRELFARLSRLSGVEAPWLPLPKNAEVARLAVRFAERLAKALGGTQPVSAEDVDVAQHYWYCDWSRAAAELGFTPRDPLVTLRDTVDDLYARGAVWPKGKAVATQRATRQTSPSA